MTVECSCPHKVEYTAADFTTVVILGLDPTVLDVAYISCWESPFSVEATMFNWYEVEASLGSYTLGCVDTSVVVWATVVDRGRVASSKGGYSDIDVDDSSIPLDGVETRPLGKCTVNFNIYGIGRISLSVTVVNSVKGPVSEEVTVWVKVHSIDVSNV